MAVIAMTGNDSLTLQNRIITEFADGAYAELTYSEDVASVKTGKNGNTVYSQNQAGLNGELVIRLVRGGSDDKFFNGLYSQQQQNFAGFVLLFGQFIKKIGDGNGVITNDIYALSGGIFTKAVGAKSTAEGEVDASVSIYTFKFSVAPRAIG
jgi:hypothetical protein